MIAVLSLATPLGAEENEQIRVEVVAPECDVDRILVYGRSILFRQATYRYEEFLQAYDGILESTQWYIANEDNEGRYSCRLLFDTYHPADTFYKVKMNGTEGLIAQVEDNTPIKETEEGTVVPTGRPDDIWLFNRDGTYRKIPAMDRDWLHEDIPYTKFAHASRLAIDAIPAQLDFETVAPYPTKLNVPLAAPKGARMGFSMRLNMGRPRSPDLKHFVGHGLIAHLPDKAKRLYNKSSGLPSNLVSCVYAEKDKCWIGFYDAPEALLNFSDHSSKMTTSDSRILSGASLIDSFGDEMLVGTFSDGCRMIDKKTLFGRKLLQLPSSRVNDIHVEPSQKRAWIATSRGLYLLKTR